MLCDLLKLFGGEGAWLVEYCLTSPDLSDVVELATEANPIQAWSGKAEPRRRGNGILADADRVTSGVCVFCLECAGQHLNSLQEQFLDPLSLFLNLPLEMLLVKTIL